jgi:hypothetical protein
LPRAQPQACLALSDPFLSRFAFSTRFGLILHSSFLPSKSSLSIRFIGFGSCSITGLPPAESFRSICLTAIEVVVVVIVVVVVVVVVESTSLINLFPYQ